METPTRKTRSSSKKATVVQAPFDSPERLKQLADFIQIEINKCLNSKRIKRINIYVEIKHALYELAQMKESDSKVAIGS